MPAVWNKLPAVTDTGIGWNAQDEVAEQRMRANTKIGKRERIFRMFRLPDSRSDELLGHEHERVRIALRRAVEKAEAPDHLIEEIRREIRK